MSPPAAAGLIEQSGLHRSAGWQETLELAGFLALLMGAQLSVCGCWDLVNRPFSLDELITFLIASDPRPAHALAGIAGGTDTNTPLLYVLLRGFTAMTGGPSESTLRLFSLAAVLVALITIYYLLRRVFGMAPALCGTLAVWAHPFLIEQAFTARFYALWLATSALYAAGLRAGKPVLLAVAAVLVCTTQWLGVLSMLTITAADLLLDERRLVERSRCLIAAAAGPLALVVCLPLLLHQRHAAPVPTWVDPPSFAQFERLVTDLCMPVSLAVVVFVFWAYQLWVRDGEPSSPQSWRHISSLAGLSSLVLFPVAMLLFSLAVQPILVDRYGSPATLGFAPVCAYLATRMSRGWVCGLIGVLILVSGASLRLVDLSTQHNDTGPLAAMVSTLRQTPPSEPIVFERRHEFYPLLRVAPDLLQRGAVLDVDLPAIPPENRVARFDHFQSRIVADYYPQMRLVPMATVSQLSAFLLVVPQTRGMDDDFGSVRQRWAHWRVTLLWRNVYQLSRS